MDQREYMLWISKIEDKLEEAEIFDEDEIDTIVYALIQLQNLYEKGENNADMETI